MPARCLRVGRPLSPIVLGLLVPGRGQRRAPPHERERAPPPSVLHHGQRLGGSARAARPGLLRSPGPTRVAGLPPSPWHRPLAPAGRPQPAGSPRRAGPPGRLGRRWCARTGRRDRDLPGGLSSDARLGSDDLVGRERRLRSRRAAAFTSDRDGVLRRLRPRRATALRCEAGWSGCGGVPAVVVSHGPSAALGGDVVGRERFLAGFLGLPRAGLVRRPGRRLGGVVARTLGCPGRVVALDRAGSA